MSEQLDIPFDATNQIGRAKLPLSPDHSPTSAFSLQPSAFSPAPATDDQVRALKRVLAERGWATRRELVTALQWSERTIRNVAEAAGADIVRGPRGFCLFELATETEIQHAANISRSQGEKMTAYGSALLKRLAQRAA